uniref:F-box/FBD/LRR-repeat protein At1g13570-like n=1 Tax=Erigeron canadensis TaxID=72917 RepID=UPI001CB94605|nr:F-box/FBD/LRR-repeat protein At1g13570-like [Erigeron canadensis]
MEALGGLDRISILPQNITEKILSLLPIPDALKTSILSRKWRYCWASIPVLTFNDQMFEGSSSSGIQNMSQKLDTVYQVLLQHKSPLVGFTLSIEPEMVSKVDQIVSYVVSRCNRLEELELANCDFEPPPKFTGFHSLNWLSFSNVEISAKMLKRFLTHCPLLDEFYLVGKQKDTTRVENMLTFVEFFECLPSIQILAISTYYMKYFAPGRPNKLPVSLVHLKILFMGVCFMDHDEVSSALCLIKSSPNLEKLMLKLVPQPTSMHFIDLQDHTGFKLDYLQELEMESLSNLSIEMEFVKLIMANSSVLKNVLIELDDSVSVDEELEMYRDLIRRPIPRASPSAEVIITRPKTSS